MKYQLSLTTHQKRAPQPLPDPASPDSVPLCPSPLNLPVAFPYVTSLLFNCKWIEAALAPFNNPLSHFPDVGNKAKSYVSGANFSLACREGTKALSATAGRESLVISHRRWNDRKNVNREHSSRLTKWYQQKHFKRVKFSINILYWRSGFWNKKNGPSKGILKNW